MEGQRTHFSQPLPVQTRTSSLPQPCFPIVEPPAPPPTIEPPALPAILEPPASPPPLKPRALREARPDSVIMAAAAAGALPPIFFEMQRNSYIPDGAFNLDLSYIPDLPGLTEKDQEEQEEEETGEQQRHSQAPPPYEVQQIPHTISEPKSQPPASYHYRTISTDSILQQLSPKPTTDHHHYHHHHQRTISSDSILQLPPITSSPTITHPHDSYQHQRTFSSNSLLPLPSPLRVTQHHQRIISTDSLLQLPALTIAHQRNISVDSCASSLSQYTATWSERDLGELDHHQHGGEDGSTSSLLSDYEDLMRELARDMDDKKGSQDSSRVPGWAKALLAWSESGGDGRMYS